MCQEDKKEFFKRLITQNETCVYHCYPQAKTQSMQWKYFAPPPPKKARVWPCNGMVMLTVFWDQDRAVITDLLGKGTKITGAY